MLEVGFLFADAKIFEDNIQNIFDMDGAGDGAQGFDGAPQMFGREFGEGSGDGGVKLALRFFK